MNEHSTRKILEGGGGMPGALARAALWLPGKAYGGAMALRRAAYARGVLASSDAGVPVISIGNITAGGSGKTPFTIMLAGELSALGKRPAILMRGYRKSAAGLSDEAMLYRRHCPDCLVEIDPDRRAGAARAVAAGADALLMDDGFQHLRLRRDLDIVLVDATSPWGGGNTIPGGLLREPMAALKAAHAVVITRSDQRPAEEVERIRKTAGRIAPAALVLTARHRPSALRRLDGNEITLSDLAGRKVVALSGIARPEAFVDTLTALGAVPVASLAGRDHDHFSREFVERALELAHREKAPVIITEKDRCKEIFAELADKNDKDIIDAVWTLEVKQEIDGKNELMSLVIKTLGV